MNLFKSEDKVVEQKGASMVEYALLVALIALVALAAVKGLGTQISGNFSSISSELNANRTATN
jgi:pilus assembly protein Flp/PilA